MTDMDYSGNTFSVKRGAAHGGTRVQRSRRCTPSCLASAAALACGICFSLAHPALGQEGAIDPCRVTPQSCPTLVSTSAMAETRIPNTAVDVSLGLTLTKDTLPAAQTELAAQSAALLRYLKAQGAQRLITTNVSFAPQTRSQKNAADKTVGYTGSTTVSFRTTPEKAPELLSGALSNGANTIDSTSFTPTEQEIDAARRELAAEATKNALAQIESVAKAVGSHVIAVRDIDLGRATPMVRTLAPMYQRTLASAEVANAPIATAEGDQQISITVTVTAAVGK